MDSLKRWREPAAWAVLVALVLDLVAVAIGALSYGLSNAAVAYRLASPTTLVALAALVAACVLVDPTPHARRLTQLSTVVGAAAVLLSLVMTLVAAAGRFALPVVDAITLISSLVVPALAVGVLARLWRLAPAATPRATLTDENSPVTVAAPDPAALSAAAPPAPDPQRQPTWSPDAAAGAVWRTAGEAATGAPATGWGAADPSAGSRWSLPDRDAAWNPVPAADPVRPGPPALEPGSDSTPPRTPGPPGPPRTARPAPGPEPTEPTRRLPPPAGR